MITPDQRPESREEWGRKKRILAWVNVILMSLFLLGGLVGINLISRKKFARKDFTMEKSFELSDDTINVLKNLDRDVIVFLVPVQNSPMYYDQMLNNAWQKIFTLVEEYKKRGSRIRFVTITEQDKGAITEHRKHFNDLSPNVIYFVCPQGGDKANKKAIAVREGDFYNGNPQTGKIEYFYGERWITTGLRSVTFSKRRILYTTVGHRELLHQSRQQDGIAVLAQFLSDRENVEIRPLPLDIAKEVPPDADAVLVAAPSTPFTPVEIDALRDYLEKGGSLFIAIMPKTQTGLATFLEAWGVKVGDNVILDMVDNVHGSPEYLNIKNFGYHEINRGMVNTSFVLMGSCTVEPSEKKDPSIEISELMKSGPTSWEEKGSLQQRNPQPDGDERRGPLSAAVAFRANFGPGKPGARRDHARVVVWGSAYSISNNNLRYFGTESNVEYTLNNFRWLFEQEAAISIPGKYSGRKPPELTPDALGRLKIVTVYGFPALGVILGVLAWFFRRK